MLMEDVVTLPMFMVPLPMLVVAELTPTLRVVTLLRRLKVEAAEVMSPPFTIISSLTIRPPIIVTSPPNLAFLAEAPLRPTVPLTKKNVSGPAL
jgi:hypothetical protein